MSGIEASEAMYRTKHIKLFKWDNVRDNRAAGDFEFVGADKIAKLSAETSLDRAPAASCSSHCYHADSGPSDQFAIGSSNLFHFLSALRGRQPGVQFILHLSLSDQHRLAKKPKIESSFLSKPERVV